MGLMTSLEQLMLLNKDSQPVFGNAPQGVVDTRTFQQYDRNNATARRQLQPIADSISEATDRALMPVNNLIGLLSDPKRQILQNLSEGLPMMVGQISPKYASKLTNSNNPTIQRALEMQRQIDEAVAAGRTDLMQNPSKKFFEDNMEYGKSTDPDLLCQRSAGTDTAVNWLKNNLGDAYSSDMAFELSAAAGDAGLMTACPQCYVFNGRAKPGGAMQKKFITGEGGYNGEVSKWNDSLIGEFPGGALRNYSSTDAKPTHWPGQIVKKIESADRGIPEGSYSKTPELAEVFGPAGDHINLSLGSDALTGMDRELAYKLRSQYPNVGTVDIPMTEIDVRKALADPNVDHVIPLHISGKPLAQYRKEYNNPNIIDYTPQQNEMVTHESNNSLRKVSPEQKIRDLEHGGDLNTYLGLAQQRNIIPKFTDFIFNSPKHIENIRQIIENIKKQRVTDTSQLFEYIEKNKQNIDPNYMKLIGPEYGKFGGEFPYKPINPKQINLDAAERQLREYLSQPVPNYSDYIDLARKYVQQRGLLSE